MTSERERGLASLAIHGRHGTEITDGSVVSPMFLSTTYMGPRHGEAVRYGRYANTPTLAAVHERLAALEGAEAAITTGSGMAAIASAMLSLLEARDHVIVHRDLYGGTVAMLREDLDRFGIAVDAVDAGDVDAVEAAITDRTRAIFVEAASNPLLRVPDLEGVVRLAKKHGLISVIDATFVTPVLFRPIPFGFDLVVHSASKYLNGHSDVIAGVVAGRAHLVDRVVSQVRRLGGVLDPHAAYLLDRGLKTLSLRMAAHCRNADALAFWLDDHPAVQRVHYPGLTSHPDHARATSWFEGYGGMLAFEVEGGMPMAQRVLDGLQLAVAAPSLGGVESLVSLPCMTSHAGLSPQERAENGIVDGLVRVSVGVEDLGDLQEDFDQALTTSQRAHRSVS